MVRCIPLVLRAALAILILSSAVPATGQDTTRNGPDFKLEYRDGRYRMQQVFPQAEPNQNVPSSSVGTAVEGGLYEHPIATSAANEWKSEIHALVNPADTANLVVMSMTSPFSNIAVYTTKDFGKTWTQTLALPQSGDPILAADADGTMHLFHLSIRGSIVLLYRTSSDGGMTWQSPADSLLATNCDKEWAAVDRGFSANRGSVYVAFLGPDNELVLRRKLPGASVFAEPPTIVSRADEFDFSQLVTVDVTPDGTLHIVFSGTKDNQEPLHLWYTRSTDGGATLSTPVPIFDLACTLTEYFNRDYKVPGFRPIFGSQIAANPVNGHLYLVWHDVVRTTERATGSNIYFARSTNGGTSWESPQIISPGEEQGNYHYLPSVSVNNRGMVCVSWYDGAADTGSSSVNVSVRYSVDNGVSFVPAVTANDIPANLAATEQNDVLNFTVGHYTQIVCTDHYAIPFWSDGRTGNSFGLYCAFVPLSQTATGVERLARLDGDGASLHVTPQPVVDHALLTVSLATPSRVRLVVSDLRGAVIGTLLDTDCAAGETQARLHSALLPAGSYFCSLYINGRLEETQKIVVIK